MSWPVSTAPVVDVLPHPLTLEGRQTVLAHAGETLEDAVGRNRDLVLGDAVALVDGQKVPRAAWAGVVLDERQSVQVRAVVRGDDTNPVAVVLTIAVIVASVYAGPALAGALGLGKAGIAANIATATFSTLGLITVAALFPPRHARQGEEEAVPRQFSLSGGRNRARPHEPLPLVLGTHRLFPDLAAREFTDFRSGDEATAAFPNDIEDYYNVGGEFATEHDTGSNLRKVGDEDAQFLNQLFDFGIGDLDVSDPRIGTTALSSYSDIEVQHNFAAVDLGLSSGVTQIPASGKVSLFAGNVDSVQGADLPENAWVTRSLAANTTSFALDIVSQHFHVDGSNELVGLLTDFEVQWKTPSQAWSAASSHTFTVRTRSGAGGRNPRRLSLVVGKLAGAHVASAFDAAMDVRVRRTTPDVDDDPRYQLQATLLAVRAFQDDEAEFDADWRNGLALRIRATDQLYGGIDEFSALVSQRVPTWDAATERWTASNHVTNNPAAIYRKLLLGWKDGSDLLAGVGLAASEVDDATLGEWHEFCESEGLACNLVVQEPIDDGDLLVLVAQCGWASPTQATGRWGVVWENASHPVSAVFTPANIVAGSMTVQYDNEGLADEIVGTYIDEDSEWEENDLRRRVPVRMGEALSETVAGRTANHTVSLPLRGITSGTQAAKEINRTAAAQFYHQRILRWQVPPEGFAATRGDVVVLAHGLVGGAVGGRFAALEDDSGTLVATPTVAVPAARGTMWVSTPAGEVESFEYDTGAKHWSVDADGRIRFEGEQELADTDEAMACRYVIYSNADADTDHRARIVGVEPEPDGGFTFTARDEIPEYYTSRTSNLASRLVPLKPKLPALKGVVVSDYVSEVIGGNQIVHVIVNAEADGNFRRGFVRAAPIVGGTAGALATVATMERDLQASFVSPVRDGTLRIVVVPGTEAFASGAAFEVDYAIGSRRIDPFAPTGMTVTEADTLNERIVQWEAPTYDGDVVGYLLRYSSDENEDWADMTPVVEGVWPSLSHTGFTPAEAGTYTWSVRSLDLQGRLSSEHRVTATLEGVAIDASLAPVPVFIVTVTGNDVRVEVTAPTDEEGIAGFLLQLWRQTDVDEYTLVDEQTEFLAGPLPAHGRGRSFENVAQGTYQVSARTQSVEGGDSPEVRSDPFVTTRADDDIPAAPAAPVVAYSSGTFTITLSLPDDEGSSPVTRIPYQIFRDGTDFEDRVLNEGIGILAARAATPPFTVTEDTDVNGTYYFRQAAQNANNNVDSAGNDLLNWSPFTEGIQVTDGSITPTVPVAGSMYAIGEDNDGNQALYRINTATGVATQVGNASHFGQPDTTNLSGQAQHFTAAGLAAVNGVLYLTGGTRASNQALYTVNTTTGVATQVGSADSFGLPAFGQPGGQVSKTFLGLAAIGTTLYGVTYNLVTNRTPHGARLYTINTTTGVATPVGNSIYFGLATGNRDFVPTGLAAYQGVLYMFMWRGVQTGGYRIYTLGLATGAVGNPLIFDTTDGNWVNPAFRGASLTVHNDSLYAAGGQTSVTPALNRQGLWLVTFNSRGRVVFSRVGDAVRYGQATAAQRFSLTGLASTQPGSDTESADAPEPPTNARFTRDGARVIWEWDASTTDGVVYEVQVERAEGLQWRRVASFTVFVGTVAPWTPTASGMYRIRVRSVKELLRSAWAVSGEDTEGPAVTEIDAPDDVVGEVWQDTGIEWGWTGVIGAESYDWRLERRSGSDWLLVLGGIVALSQVNTFNLANGLYRLRVRSKAGSVVSDWSESVSIAIGETVVVVEPPTDVSVSLSGGSVFLDWTRSTTPDARSEAVIERQDGGDWEEVWRTNTTSGSHASFRASAGTYRGRVRAYVGQFSSAWVTSANTVTVAGEAFTVEPPTSLAGQATNAGGIDFVWNASPTADAVYEMWLEELVDDVVLPDPDRFFTGQNTSLSVNEFQAGPGNWRLRLRALATNPSGGIEASSVVLSETIHVLG